MLAAAFATSRRSSVSTTTKTSGVNLFIGDRLKGEKKKRNTGSDHLILFIQASVQHKSGGNFSRDVILRSDFPD